MTSKKKLIFVLLDVVVLVMVVGVSLAVFQYSKPGEESNSVKIGAITLTYTEGRQTINIENADPLEDEKGKVLGLGTYSEEDAKCTDGTDNHCYFDFTVEASMTVTSAISYEVTLKQDEDNTLDGENVRLYLEKKNSEGNYQEVLSPTSFTEIGTDDELGASADEMLLTTSEITGNETHYYRLRMWIDENYNYPNVEKEFIAKVNVYARNIELNQATRIDLNYTTLSMQLGDDDKTLTAEVKPDNTKNKNVIYTSSNPSVVKVASNGALTAVGIGTATITVTTYDGSISATCSITVVDSTTSGVTLDPTVVQIVKGSSKTIDATVTPSNASDKTLTWTSSNEYVATVDQSGTILGRNIGEATITATTVNGKTATVNVTVIDADIQNLNISGTTPIDIGATTQLSTTITPSTVSSVDIVYESANDAVATVTSSGLVTGVTEGETTITAYVREYPDTKATISIKVQKPAISSITMTSDMTINVGNSTTFAIWISPSVVRNQDKIRWKSLNEKVATIPESCKGNLTCTVTGQSDGSASPSATIKAVVVDDDENETSVSATATLYIKYAVATVDSSGANAPNLLTNMIPVIYGGNGTWLKADTSVGWYNYSDRIWANAVTVTSSTRSTYKSAAAGTAIAEGDIMAYWVWIPRYSYTIKCASTDTNCYGHVLDSTGSTPSLATPGAIDVKFESGTTTSNGTGRYTGTKPDNYYTPPGFTFDNKALKGVWVSKFELTGTYSENGASLTSKPNLSSVRSQTTNAFYKAIQNGFTTNGSSYHGFSGSYNGHMARNTEWSLMSYLSQSVYGKYGNPNYSGANKEIYQNKSSSYTTGNSNGTPSTSTTNTQVAYNVEGSGTGASTTGTIYGIYDTSGGAWEYVMAAAATGSSGFAASEISSSNAYLDFYSSYDRSTACGGSVCRGQGLNTTAGWYGDFTYFIASTYPWLLRGGPCGDDTIAGVFSYSSYAGHADSHDSARVVLSTW